VESAEIAESVAAGLGRVDRSAAKLTTSRRTARNEKYRLAPCVIRSAIGMNTSFHRRRHGLDTRRTGNLPRKPRLATSVDDRGAI
jgi:hypothetical protein